MRKNVINADFLFTVDLPQKILVNRLVDIPGFDGSSIYLVRNSKERDCSPGKPFLMPCHFSTT